MQAAYIRRTDGRERCGGARGTLRRPNTEQLNNAPAAVEGPVVATAAPRRGRSDPTSFVQVQKIGPISFTSARISLIVRKMRFQRKNSRIEHFSGKLLVHRNQHNNPQIPKKNGQPDYTRKWKTTT